MRISHLNIFILTLCILAGARSEAQLNSLRHDHHKNGASSVHSPKIWPIPIPPPKALDRQNTEKKTSTILWPLFPYWYFATQEAKADLDQDAWNRYASVLLQFGQQPEIQVNPAIIQLLEHIFRVIGSDPPSPHRDSEVMKAYLAILKVIDKAGGNENAFLHAAAKKYQETIEKDQPIEDQLSAYSHLAEAYGSDLHKETRFNPVIQAVSSLSEETKKLSSLSKSRNLSPKDLEDLYSHYYHYASSFSTVLSLYRKEANEAQIKQHLSSSPPCSPVNSHQKRRSHPELDEDEEEEESSQSFSSSKTEKKKNHAAPDRGLKNSRARCYMNAALQLLARNPITEVLKTKLSKNPDESDELYQAKENVRINLNQVTQKLNTKVGVDDHEVWIDLLHHSFANFHAIKLHEEFQKDPKLDRKGAYDLVASQFKGLDQKKGEKLPDDPVQRSKYFLALLQDSKADPKILEPLFYRDLTELQKSSDEYLSALWDILDLKKSNPLQIETQITYQPESNEQKNRVDQNETNFIQLFLDGKSSTLDQLLAQYLKPYDEPPTATRLYTTSIKKQFTADASSPPKSVVFELSRALSGTEKSEQSIDFSEHLQFPITDKTGTKLIPMTLKAITVHLGKTAASGHYVSYQRDAEKKTWTLFDDSAVEDLTEAQMDKSVGTGNGMTHRNRIKTGGTHFLYVADPLTPSE